MLQAGRWSLHLRQQQQRQEDRVRHIMVLMGTILPHLRARTTQMQHRVCLPPPLGQFSNATLTLHTATATPAPSNLNQTLIFLTPTSTRIPSSTPFPTSAAATTTTTSLSSVWIAGPVMGSILGMSTVFLVIFFTRRKQRAQLRGQPLPSALSSPTSKEFPHSDSAPSNRSSSNPTPPPEVRVSAPPGELECSEIHELPAREPVGSELNTPRDVLQQDGEGEEVVREEWPMPLSPLPLLFAMSELRDKQAKVNNDSPKHETFYHP